MAMGTSLTENESDNGTFKEAHTLPLADAPSIVRAHQKDTYFESVLREKLQTALLIFTGQGYVYSHPEELSITAKVLYLALTTVAGTRTLGEEYTDLIYVTRNGRKIPRIIRKIGFVISYALLPYAIMKMVKKFYPPDDSADANSEARGSQWYNIFKGITYPKVLDTLLNLHLAIFYLHGAYYSLSKRIFGLRYAFGHKVDKNEEVSRGGYELLGGLIISRILFKSISKTLDVFVTSTSEWKDDESESSKLGNKIFGVPKEDNHKQIDLSNPRVQRFIPENSRKCMLCLSYMVNPCCATCGHMFCWSCISDWSREHSECPLCRQELDEQSLLPVR